MRTFASGIFFGAILAMAAHMDAAAQTRILYLSKSSGFEHSVVKRANGQPSLSEKVLSQLASEHGAEITCTKDASLINAGNLKHYDLVIFYTSGNLTEPGTDGEPAMGPEGVRDLIEWVRNGGGFIGLHAATDTFRTPADQPPHEFTRLIGASFLSHGDQFKGTVKVIDATHPAVQGLPKDWQLEEEWYQFAQLDKENMHVLALLDPGEERARQEAYNVPSYPIIWCKTFGSGRVYYNGLGHREDVWNNPTFQASIVRAATWAIGESPAQAEPNYELVVPKDLPAPAPQQP